MTNQTEDSDYFKIDCLAIHDDQYCNAKAGCTWLQDDTFPYTGTCICDQSHNLVFNNDAEPVCICKDGYGRDPYDSTSCIQCPIGEHDEYDDNIAYLIPCHSCHGRGRIKDNAGNCICNNTMNYHAKQNEEITDTDCDCKAKFYINPDGVCVKQKASISVAMVMIMLGIIVVTAINCALLVIRSKQNEKLEQRQKVLQQVL